MNNFDEIAKSAILHEMEEKGVELTYHHEGGKIKFDVVELLPVFENGRTTRKLGNRREIVISESDRHSGNFTLKAFYMGLREFVFASPRHADPVWAELVPDFASKGRLAVRFFMDGKHHSLYIFANPNPAGYGFEFVMPDGIPENVVA